MTQSNPLDGYNHDFQKGRRYAVSDAINKSAWIRMLCPLNRFSHGSIEIFNEDYGIQVDSFWLPIASATSKQRSHDDSADNSEIIGYLKLMRMGSEEKTPVFEVVALTPLTLDDNVIEIPAQWL